MNQQEWPMIFDKEMTAIIKGTALIFMMLLHCYGSSNYDVALNFSYSPISRISGVFKICISIFAFMVGFGYSFSKERDLSYCINHIRKLLIPFWLIMIIFTFPLCWSDVCSSGWKTLLYNMIGIDSHFNYYSWFVYFYIYAMIVMPYVSFFIDRCPIWHTILMVFLSVLLTGGIHYVFGIGTSRFAMALFNCSMMTPTTVLGYLFGREHYYERLKINKKLPKWCVLLFAVSLIVIVLRIRFYRWGWNGFLLDFFYAPIVIGALVVIFNKFEFKPLRGVLVRIGDLSTYMWFFHALFFTKAVRWFYQPAITVFSDVNLVVLWTIILTYVVSWIIKRLVDIVSLRFVGLTS